MAIVVPLSEAKDLLNSDEVSSIETAVASARGLILFPYHQASAFKRELELAGIEAYQALELFRSNRDYLIRFTICVHKDADGDDPDGEFPQGEEPDPEDRSEVTEVLGLGGGFSITSLCYFVLSEPDRKADLATFLKSTRIPYASKFAATLRRIRRDTAGSETDAEAE
jgi:hypothetical protein